MLRIFAAACLGLFVALAWAGDRDGQKPGKKAAEKAAGSKSGAQADSAGQRGYDLKKNKKQ